MDDLYILAESIDDIDIYSILVELTDLQKELEAQDIYLMQTVFDIIYNNCTYIG